MLIVECAPGLEDVHSWPPEDMRKFCWAEQGSLEVEGSCHKHDRLIQKTKRSMFAILMEPLVACLLGLVGLLLAGWCNGVC